jgi:hypothetical protein
LQTFPEVEFTACTFSGNGQFVPALLLPREHFGAARYRSRRTLDRQQHEIQALRDFYFLLSPVNTKYPIRNAEVGRPAAGREAYLFENVWA